MRKICIISAFASAFFTTASIVWDVVPSAKQDMKRVDSPARIALFEKCKTCGMTKESCGGVVVCFGCREVYVKEPVNGMEHYKLILQKDVSQKDGWEAL